MLEHEWKKSERSVFDDTTEDGDDLNTSEKLLGRQSWRKDYANARIHVNQAGNDLEHNATND